MKTFFLEKWLVSFWRYSNWYHAFLQLSLPLERFQRRSPACTRPRCREKPTTFMADIFKGASNLISSCQFKFWNMENGFTTMCIPLQSRSVIGMSNEVLTDVQTVRTKRFGFHKHLGFGVLFSLDQNYWPDGVSVVFHCMPAKSFRKRFTERPKSLKRLILRELGDGLKFA